MRDVKQTHEPEFFGTYGQHAIVEYSPQREGDEPMRLILTGFPDSFYESQARGLRTHE